jgi:hypothetical protein
MMIPDASERGIEAGRLSEAFVRGPRLNKAGVDQPDPRPMNGTAGGSTHIHED